MTAVNTKEFMEAAAQAGNMDELVDVFRQYGVDATAEEIAQAINEAAESIGGELGEEELEAVSGGYRLGDFTRGAYNAFQNWVSKKVNEAVDHVLGLFGL